MYFKDFLWFKLMTCTCLRILFGLRVTKLLIMQSVFSSVCGLNFDFINNYNSVSYDSCPCMLMLFRSSGDLKERDQTGFVQTCSTIPDKFVCWAQAAACNGAIDVYIVLRNREMVGQEIHYKKNGLLSYDLS